MAEMVKTQIPTEEEVRSAASDLMASAKQKVAAAYARESPVPSMPNSPLSSGVGPTASPVKPDGRPGIEKKSESPEPPRSESPEQVARPVATGPTTVTLDPLLIAQIELVTTKRRLAEKEALIAKIDLKNALDQQATLQIEESYLLAMVSKQVGKKITGGIKLVDRSKGLVQIG